MACEDVLVEKELALEAAFEAQFEYMVHSIDAGSVITPCFAEGLINDHEQDQCFHEHDSLERAKLLLYYVKKSISGEDQRARKNFGLFIDILRGTGHYIQADKLCKNTQLTQHQLTNSNVLQSMTECAVFTCTSRVHKGYASMRIKGIYPLVYMYT